MANELVLHPIFNWPATHGLVATDAAIIISSRYLPKRSQGYFSLCRLHDNYLYCR